MSDGFPDWLRLAKRVDLSGSKGYHPGSPLHGPLLGVCLHVNDAPDPGTSDEFFSAGPPTNPDNVCPNFQVYTTPVDGRVIHQYLPYSVRPWCQVDGNQNYVAIETGGRPNVALNAAQIRACGRIMAVAHKYHGVPLAVVDAPGQRGLILHSDGGNAWGGHFGCPGNLRAAQRVDIIAAARKLLARWSNN